MYDPPLGRATNLPPRLLNEPRLLTDNEGYTIVQLFERVWQCFYCGEVCVGQTEAEDHFGLDEWAEDGAPAACVDPLTKDEKELRSQWMDTERELRGERDHSHHLSLELEQASSDAAASRDTYLWLRKKLAEHDGNPAETGHDARMAWDSIEGRLLTAEAYVAELRLQDPALYQKIQDTIFSPSYSTRQRANYTDEAE